MTPPLQKILFGSPGTGKSHKIDNNKDGIILKGLGITNRENIIKTVFHPEYTYGDFIGKLTPITRSGKGENKVEYNFYEGHFLKALSQAYKNIYKANGDVNSALHVALVIDEINRGNSAAIFGSVFQLLDRESDGWSSYAVNVNEIIFTKILELILHPVTVKYDSQYNYFKMYHTDDAKKIHELTGTKIDLINKAVQIPPNLSILATMNTSDSSIYYMDSAFKRRWEWEFIDINSESVCEEGIAFKNEKEWKDFIVKLNTFIKKHHQHVRGGIEDKQIGYYFIKDWLYGDKQIKKATIQNKLMFFLWDSVFNRDKKPLIHLLYGVNQSHHPELVTFGDFAKKVGLFITKINEEKHE